MKNIIQKSSFALLLIVALMACNKSNRNSRRVEGYKWKVTSINVNGNAETNLPTLLFKDCDIYNEVCKGTWISDEDGRAEFVWQFRDKGKTIEIANQTDHVHDVLDVKAAEQCIAFTGVYEVVNSKRKSLSIKSTKANAYQGKEVKIEMERLD